MGPSGVRGPAVKGQGGAYERALAFTRRQRMFREGERVLVGVSGGASLGLLGFLMSAQAALGLAEIACASVETDIDEGSDAGSSREDGRPVLEG